jgi:FkbM family methyltransferase
VKYTGNTENWIDASIHFFGAFEKHLLFFLRDVAQQVFHGNVVFVDVGANTGQYSLFMSQFVKKVHAIEPYEPVVKRLRGMIELNGIDTIEVHPVGLAAKGETLRFKEPQKGNMGIGSFEGGLYPPDAEAISLPLVRGDELLRNETSAPIGLMKMDIEGFEKPALEGLKDTLSKHRPILLLEVSPAAAEGFKTKESLKAAFPDRYSFFVSASEDPVYGRYHFETFDALAELREQIMVVAVPNERLGSVSLVALQDR